MRICDKCRDETKSTQVVQLRMDTPNVPSQQCGYDLCGDCRADVMHEWRTIMDRLKPRQQKDTAKKDTASPGFKDLAAAMANSDWMYTYKSIWEKAADAALVEKLRLKKP